MAHEIHHGEAGERTQESHIEMPALTFWPMVFAFGITLLCAGLLTHWVVSAVGFILALRSGIGWWHTVIPHEEHEEIPVDPKLRPAPIMVEQRSVVRLRAGEAHHRMHMPETVHPYSAGFWGGLAGGAVMAGLACLYGLIAQHSIWYPVNLLAGVIMPGINYENIQQLRQFHVLEFVAALIGHGIISTLVGVIYAVALPMFPKHAPIWAGVIVPLFWTGLVATTLDLLNPALSHFISWPWFIACQLGYGLVGGYVIARSTHIRLMQSWDLAERAFLHAPGLRPVRREDQK